MFLVFNSFFSLLVANSAEILFAFGAMINSEISIVNCSVASVAVWCFIFTWVWVRLHEDHFMASIAVDRLLLGSLLSWISLVLVRFSSSTILKNRIEIIFSPCSILGLITVFRISKGSINASSLKTTRLITIFLSIIVIYYLYTAEIQELRFCVWSISFRIFDYCDAADDAGATSQNYEAVNKSNSWTSPMIFIFSKSFH